MWSGSEEILRSTKLIKHKQRKSVFTNITPWVSQRHDAAAAVKNVEDQKMRSWVSLCKEQRWASLFTINAWRRTHLWQWSPEKNNSRLSQPRRSDGTTRICLFDSSVPARTVIFRLFRRQQFLKTIFCIFRTHRVAAQSSTVSSEMPSHRNVATAIISLQLLLLGRMDNGWGSTGGHRCIARTLHSTCPSRTSCPATTTNNNQSFRCHQSVYGMKVQGSWL